MLACNQGAHLRHAHTLHIALQRPLPISSCGIESVVYDVDTCWLNQAYNVAQWLHGRCQLVYRLPLHS